MSNNYITATGAVSSLETLHLPSGLPVVQFILAGFVTQGAKGRTQFTQISLIAPRAESIGQNLKDGDTVRVVGRLEVTEWTGSDGEKHSKQAIKASDIYGIAVAPDRLKRLPSGQLRLEEAELRVSLIGRAGRDLEIKPYGANGGSLASTGIAVDERWPDTKNPGQWVSKTSWFNVQWWDMVEIEPIKKGQLLFVEGVPTSGNFNGITVLSHTVLRSLSNPNPNLHR